MDQKIKEGQTVLILDRKDIALVVREDGTHEAYISSEVDEDEETLQNYKVVLILAALNGPEKFKELIDTLKEGAK